MCIFYTIGLPSPVTQLSLDNVECRTANISWQRAFRDEACGAESYEVSIIGITPPGGVVETGILLGSFGTMYSTTRLNASSTYSVTVTTTNRVGSAEPSAPIVFTTMDEQNYTSIDGEL